jgi:hypothetical protein
MTVIANGASNSNSSLRVDVTRNSGKGSPVASASAHATHGAHNHANNISRLKRRMLTDAFTLGVFKMM